MFPIATTGRRRHHWARIGMLYLWCAGTFVLSPVASRAESPAGEGDVTPRETTAGVYGSYSVASCGHGVACGTCPRCFPWRAPHVHPPDRPPQPADTDTPRRPASPQTGRGRDDLSPREPAADEPAAQDLFSGEPSTPFDQAPSFAADPSRPGLASASLPNIRGNFCMGPGQVIILPYLDMEQNGEIPTSPILSDLPALGCSRRIKIAENNNPFPACRVFFTYDYFHNTAQSTGPPGQRRGLGVDRYVLGIERTFLEGLASIEVRLPMVRDLDPTQVLEGSGDLESNEIGNLSVTFKAILTANEWSVLSAGMGINFPTGPDGRIRGLDPFFNEPRTLVQYDNESVHLAPFAAYGVVSRDRRFFAQAWAQLDFDTNGSSVRADAFGVQGSGRLQDQTLLFLDGMIGWSLLDRPCPPGPARLRRITPALELHYTGTLQDADTFTTPNVSLGNLANRMDVLDLTVACHFEFGRRLVVTPAYVTPLTQGDNRFFDGEFGVQVNYYH